MRGENGNVVEGRKSVGWLEPGTVQYRELGEILASDTGNEGRKYRERREMSTGYEGRVVPGLKGEIGVKSPVKLDTCQPVKHIQSSVYKEHKQDGRSPLIAGSGCCFFILLGKEV